MSVWCAAGLSEAFSLGGAGVVGITDSRCRGRVQGQYLGTHKDPPLKDASIYGLLNSWKGNVIRTGSYEVGPVIVDLRQRIPYTVAPVESQLP